MFASRGPSVNIATGIGGRRCSKRGSVSLDFKIAQSNFRIINMHLKSDSFANRLRDLSKILEAHQLAVQNQGMSIFLVGAFNFSQKQELQKTAENGVRGSCEMISLKDCGSGSQTNNPALPGIDE